MSDTEIKKYEFSGAESGPHLTVLGAVHGNENCGPEALNKLIGLIEGGDIELKKGKLTLVPVCNPRANEQQVRFTERNLNRFMYPKDEPQVYEDHLDNQLCPILERTDYLVDLHSYTSPGSAFIFVGQLDKANIDFAKALGVPRFIYGWADAISSNDDVKDKRQAMGTTEYAREHGAVGLTLECGQHQCERASDVGFQAALNAIAHLGLADIDESLNITDLPDSAHYNIRMKGSFIKVREGDYVEDRKNMDPVKAGTVIARYEDGEELVIPEDGYIVLPKRDTDVGHEWFYWGVEDALDEEG